MVSVSGLSIQHLDPPGPGENQADAAAAKQIRGVRGRDVCEGQY